MKAAQSSGRQSDTAAMPNGSHAEADGTSEQPEEVDEATAVKRQLLIKAAPLAGVWGLERFGLADVTVLKLLEALPGQPTKQSLVQAITGVCEAQYANYGTRV